MNREHEREKWLADIDARQRNIVFPDTTQNEARFWRNLGNPAFNTPAKIGLLVLGGWVASLIIAFFAAIFSDADGKQELIRFTLGMIVLFGPIFAGIAWATHRTLRSLNEARKRKH